MAYDGNGAYNLPAPQYPAIPGTTILAEDFNTIMADITAALSLVLVRDGQAAMTGVLNMGQQNVTQIASLVARAAGMIISGQVTFSGGPISASGQPIDFDAATLMTVPADTRGTTAAPGTNSTLLATCEFVLTQAMNAALPLQPGGTTPYKLRSLAGVASWVIEQVKRSARVANTILAGADSGTFIDITANTFSQTLTAAATLGDGWYCYYRNSGSGLITLDPNGAELIDGAATKTLQFGQSVIIYCDGVGFTTNTLDDQSFDASSALYYNSLYTQTSGSFVAKKTGWHRLSGVGGGGSGGVSMPSLQATPGKACGGAAGGYVSKRVWLTQGATVTYTIGAGGALTTRAVTNGSVNGTAGGSTTIVANGLTLTANGGAGGNASITAATVNGAVGGTATGGDINNQGGGSGNCIGLGHTATGGGCIGFVGPGKSSGNADAQVANSAAATGGAGTGGASGAATATATNFGSSTGGGGAAGDSPAVTAAVLTAGVGGVGYTSPLFFPTSCNAAGSAATSVGSPSANVATPGGGTGGGAGQVSVSSGNANLGGSGGASDISTGAGALTNGTPGPGCGSGGAEKCVNNVAVTSPAGGNGFVLIEW